MMITLARSASNLMRVAINLARINDMIELTCLDDPTLHTPVAMGEPGQKVCLKGIVRRTTNGDYSY